MKVEDESEVSWRDKSQILQVKEGKAVLYLYFTWSSTFR